VIAQAQQPLEPYVSVRRELQFAALRARSGDGRPSPYQRIPRRWHQFSLLSCWAAGVLVMLFCCFPHTVLSQSAPAGPAPTAWPNGYEFQATFTVAPGKVSSAQTNFPALISGTWKDFATTANGGRINNTCNQTVGNNVTAVPCDLIFTSDAAGTQLLNWEYETYTATTGAVNIWVNLPNLANGTVIYAWYGQPATNTLRTSPAATWSNYMAVYHMKEDPAGIAPQLNDSTGNGNNATMKGVVAASQQQAGEINSSINFEGDSYASLASSSIFNFERTDSFSVSGWFKISANSVGALISKYPAPSNAGWALAQMNGSPSPQFALGLFGTGASTGAFAETTSPASMGVWHYVVATYSGTGTVAGMNIYVDGVNQALTTKQNNLATSILNNDPPAINSRVGIVAQESNDAMDELRVSAKGVVLSSAWVSASYNNQSSPGTFFTVATGLAYSPALPSLTLSPGLFTFPGQAVNTTSAVQAFTLTNSGSGTATGIAPRFTGANPSGFTIATGANACGATLAAGSSCSIYLTFTPASATGFTAALSVTDNGANSPQTATLNGSGVAVLSGLTCNPASMAGSGTDTCTVTLNAAAPAGGVVVSLSSNNAAVTLPATAMVPANAASAGFMATVAGVATTQTSTLTATAGGISSAFVLPLNPALPTLSINATSVPFGNVEVNMAATQSVTLTSTGTSPAAVSAATVTGAGFTMSGVTFPVALNPGQATTLNLQFDPSIAGAATGLLTIASNSSTGAVTLISLSGTGTAPVVDLSWNAPSNSTDPVAGYNIYRSTGGSPAYALLNSSTITETTYVDTTVMSGQIYDYIVESVDASGVASSPSNLASVTIP
jgi:hypothetical protein